MLLPSPALRPRLSAAAVEEQMIKRQLDGSNNGTGNGDGNGGYVFPNENHNFWWTPAGLAVRYAIVAVLFGGLLLFFAGGYYHAQRRVRQGKRPYAYHRWMLRPSRPISMQPPRSGYAYTPRYGDTNRNGYQLETYAPPPPAYHQAEAPPPVYAPPPGASKTLADQNFREVEVDGGERGEGSSASATETASGRGSASVHHERV